MKRTPLFCLLSLFLLLLNDNTQAQCPSSTAGQLSGNMTFMLATDTTAMPVYTTVPSGLPNTEFLIIQNDSIATDGFGPRILLSSMNGRVVPANYGFTNCNEICVLPFSYDLTQLQLVVDSLLFAEYTPGTSCCDAAGAFFIGLCDSLNSSGIFTGADVTDLNDVITLMGIFAGTSGGSTSVFSLTSTIDQLNMVMALFGNCAGGLTEICYATVDSTFAKDCYTVTLPNAATSVVALMDTVWLAPNASTTLSAMYFPSILSDTIAWFVSGAGSTTVNSVTGQVTAGNMAETVWVIAQAVRGCAKDTVVVIVDPALAVSNTALVQTPLKTIPNPFENVIQVQFYATGGDYTLELVGITGQVYQYKNYTLTAGNQYLTLDTQLIPSGCYFLKIIGEKTQGVQTIVKQ